MDTQCLYTTVRNTSGQTRVFSFLGAHGVRLAANETYTVPGDLFSALASKRPSRRAFKAMEAAVRAGHLAIVRTPGVFLYDQTQDQTRMLSLDNGALGSVSPCWESSSEAV